MKLHHVLLKDVESNAYIIIENALYAFIAIRKKQIIPELINELEIKGTKTVAEAYLNYYITATKAGMKLPDADLKIGHPGKWQYIQKDFFYRVGYRRKNGGN